MSKPTNQNVLIDRIKFIGGSEISAIMGISPFKTRWQLLQEKAGIIEPEIVDNAYVDYGSEMEKYIRNYINFLDEYKNDEFYEDTLTKEEEIISTRCNVDGRNSNTILEIKTTSIIHETLEEYKNYLVQVLYYAYNYELDNIILAVYERPKDFNTDFDPEQLTIFKAKVSDYAPLVEEIKKAVIEFKNDLKKLKENPNLTESDFMPMELVNYANQIQILENKLKEYKQLEKQQEELKTKLYESMYNLGIKTWTTPNNVKITLVEEIPSSIIKEEKFDEETFKKDHLEEYQKYLIEVEKKKSGKKGYIRLTIGKEE